MAKQLAERMYHHFTDSVKGKLSLPDLVEAAERGAETARLKWESKQLVRETCTGREITLARWQQLWAAAAVTKSVGDQLG